MNVLEEQAFCMFRLGFCSEDGSRRLHGVTPYSSYLSLWDRQTFHKFIHHHFFEDFYSYLGLFCEIITILQILVPANLLVI